MMMTDEEIEYQQDQAEAALDELGQITPGISIPNHIDQLFNIIQRQHATIEKMVDTHQALIDSTTDAAAKRLIELIKEVRP